MQADHVASHMWNRGTDDLSNLLPACPLCNRCKNTMTVDEFRKWIEEDAPRIHFAKNRKWYADADRIVDAYGLKPSGNKVVFCFEKGEKR